MQLKVWLESDLAGGLLERAALKQSVEMWRVAHALRGSQNAPDSLFGKPKPTNGDGLRRATGPGSFDAVVESAKREKQAREASQE